MRMLQTYPVSDVVKLAYACTLVITEFHPHFENDVALLDFCNVLRRYAAKRLQVTVPPPAPLKDADVADAMPKKKGTGFGKKK
jgi:hypothetical protein